MTSLNNYAARVSNFKHHTSFREKAKVRKAEQYDCAIGA